MRRFRSLQPVSVPLARADKVGAGYEFKLKLLNPGLAGSKPLRVHLEASTRPPLDCLISRAAMLMHYHRWWPQGDFNKADQ
jgi:hypothetical protein